MGPGLINFYEVALLYISNFIITQTWEMVHRVVVEFTFYHKATENSENASVTSSHWLFRPKLSHVYTMSLG